NAESIRAMTVDAPSGSNSFGRPIRRLCPAAGTTANSRTRSSVLDISTTLARCACERKRRQTFAVAATCRSLSELHNTRKTDADQNKHAGFLKHFSFDDDAHTADQRRRHLCPGAGGPARRVAAAGVGRCRGPQRRAERGQPFDHLSRAAAGPRSLSAWKAVRAG